MPTRIILTFGIVNFALQAICAVFDDFFSHQLRLSRTHGIYVFVEHLGAWMDLLVITPYLAYMMSQHTANYKSALSGLMAILAILFALGMLGGYAAGAASRPDIVRPDAYYHDGHLTAAGWLHGLFAAGIIYFFLMLYFTPLRPSISINELLVAACVLSALLLGGLVKLTPDWTFAREAKLQFAYSLFVVWLITALRILAMRL